MELKTEIGSMVQTAVSTEIHKGVWLELPQETGTLRMNPQRSHEK